MTDVDPTAVLTSDADDVDPAAVLTGPDVPDVLIIHPPPAAVDDDELARRQNTDIG